MQTIAELFQARLGAPHPDAADLESLPIDSPCGQDCAEAIHAAAALMEHCRAAAGPSPVDAVIRAIVADVVSIYWRG